MHQEPIFDDHSAGRAEPIENDAAYFEAIREGTMVAIRAASFWTPIWTLCLILGFSLSRNTFLASDQILDDAGHDWAQALWPAALYGVFGLAFGSFLGWRINIGAGLVGGPAWRIGALAVGLLCAVGVVASMFIFSEGIPRLVYVSAALIAVTALGGVTFFAKWNG